MGYLISDVILTRFGRLVCAYVLGRFDVEAFRDFYVGCHGSRRGKLGYLLTLDDEMTKKMPTDVKNGKS